MVAGSPARGEDRAGLGAVVRTQAAVQRILVAPGALLAVLSGLMLTFTVTRLRGGETAGFSIWLVLMQGAGLVGALIVLMVGLPTASQAGAAGSGGAGCGAISTSCGSGSGWWRRWRGCSRWRRWWRGRRMLVRER